MKYFISALLLSFVLFASPAKAAAVSAEAVVIQMSTSGASLTTWTPLLAQSSKAIKAIGIYSGTAPAFEVGVAASSQASTAEVRQLVVAPGTLPDNRSNGSTNIYPISISQGQRISLRLLNSLGGATQGYVQAVFYYF